MTIQLWERPDHVATANNAQVFLLAFAREPVDVTRTMSMAKYGVPSREALAAVEGAAIARASDPAWFDNWRTGSLRILAQMELGDDLAKLDAAEHVNTITAELRDPKDLGYLQASWAIAKWLAEGGADVFIDVFAGRFYTAKQVLALDSTRELEIQAETMLVFETDVRAPYDGHLMHTRGMIKFARPDVLLVVDGEHNDDDAAIVNGIARGLADGRVLTVGEVIRIGDATLRATSYSPTPDEDVNLNNEGLLLVRV
jgi:hypothetical protein